MSLTNPDTKQMKLTDLRNRMADAIRDQNEESLAAVFQEYNDMATADILNQVNAQVATIETSAALAGRGVRQLTTEEKKFYQAIIPAMQDGHGIANIDVAFPQTVINSVLDDIRQEHPLLALIDMRNTSGVTKWFVNTQGSQTAVWGPLGSAITKELTGAIEPVDMTAKKLSAYFLIPQDILTLGPTWVDSYIRAILYEAILVGLETAVVDGTGKDEPIGMTRDVSTDVSVTGGVYPRKAAISVTELSPEVYGTLLSKLATTPNGNARVVRNPVFLVNPADYFKVVFPATTIQSVSGGYAKDVLPYPTNVIQSVGVPVGGAVLGLAPAYFMGIGTTKNGKIETSDEYHFLEDERTYKIKLLGNGRPKDNTAFLYLDISGLKPTYPTVKNIPQTTTADEAGE